MNLTHVNFDFRQIIIVQIVDMMIMTPQMTLEIQKVQMSHAVCALSGLT